MSAALRAAQPSLPKMKLWRFNDGLPSYADALFVACGPLALMVLFSRTADPILGYFEPRGLNFLGLTLLFLVFLSALGLILFSLWWTNQKVREEVRRLRLVFAAIAFPVVLISFGVLLFSLPFRWLSSGVPYGIGATLILGAALAYVIMVHSAIRRPLRTANIMGWIVIGLGVLGIVGKIAQLVAVARK